MGKDVQFFDVEETFNEAGKFIERYDEVLADLGFVQGIDEIALLFPHRGYAWSFVAEAVREEGCVLFNSATDHVHTKPLRTCYDVTYLFLTLPAAYHPSGRSGVRLECMFLGDGVSPLHEAEIAKMDIGDEAVSPVHASFKCGDEEDYANATTSLREAGWESVQRCESTYGRFAYWSPLHDETPGVYLKPRVNLRDGQQEFV